MSQIIQALKSDFNFARESTSQLCSGAIEGSKLHVLGPVSDTQQASLQHGSCSSATSHLGYVATTTQENTQLLVATTRLERPREMFPSRLVMLAASSQASTIHRGHFQSSRFHGFKCTCKPTSPRHRSASRRSIDTHHKGNCPVAFLNRSRASATGIRILKTIFTYLASVTHYRVEYNFTARAIVPGHSPAFLLIDNLNDLRLARNEGQLESRCLAILTDLKEISQQNKGWPTDTLSNDMNFLHVGQQAPNQIKFRLVQPFKSESRISGPALESAASGLSLWLMSISSFLKPLSTWVSRLMGLVHTGELQSRSQCYRGY